MELKFSLRNVESNSTTRVLTRKIKQQARWFEGNGLLPKWVKVDVRLFLDMRDIPGRNTMKVTGGPSLDAEYSASEDRTWPTFQQTWQAGCLIVDLDRRFSKSSKTLASLFEAVHPIEVSAYAIAQVLGKAEGLVQIDWFGLFETQTSQPQIAIRLQTKLVVFEDKIKPGPPARTKEVLRWET